MRQIHICIALVAAVSLSAHARDTTWQQRIQSTFINSFADGEAQFAPIIEELEMQQEASDDMAVDYWLAFAHYRAAIFYISEGKNELSEEHINQAIWVFDDREDLSSEDHALLGTMLGFSISFSPGEAMVLSAKANKHLQDAIDKNPENMRAYLGMGRNDFYRPVEYGGGLVAEKHLQKALSLPASSAEDPNAPSWGRDEAFMVLASYYQREDRTQEAILTCKRGLKEFPGHSGIQEILDGLQK